MCWVDQVQEESFPFKSFYRQKRGHFIEYFYCMRKWYLYKINGKIIIYYLWPTFSTTFVHILSQMAKK